MSTTKSAMSIESLALSISKKAVQDAIKAVKTTHTETKSSDSVFIFFNCDADKNVTSMDIRYNNEAFGDNATGRKLLLKRVEQELAAGNISTSDAKAVRETILTGEPTDAGALLQYGTIERLLAI